MRSCVGRICIGVLALLGVFAGRGLYGQDTAPKEDPIARVVAVRGAVSVRRGDGGAPEQVGLKDPLRVGDVIDTGRRGRVQLSFKDGSIISLGRETTIEITHYEYDPSESKAGMETEVKQGFFRVLGGAITKMAPGNFKTHTPTATIGVRGSYYAGEATPDITRVAFLGGQGIFLENEFGTLDLDQAGDVGEAGGQAPPEQVDDDLFIQNALAETGVAGSDERDDSEEDEGAGRDGGEADEADDDGDDEGAQGAGAGQQEQQNGGRPAPQMQGKTDDPSSWGGAGQDDDVGGDAGAPEAGGEDLKQDDDVEINPDELVDPDDEVNQRVEEVIEEADSQWNGLAIGWDAQSARWFDTETDEDFRVLNKPSVAEVSGVLQVQSTSRAAGKPSLRDQSRTVPEARLVLPLQVAGSSPRQPMELHASVSDVPDGWTAATGTAVPLQGVSEVATSLPGYLSWGAWNADLTNPNEPATSEQSRIEGFWVLGRRTTEQRVGDAIARDVVGDYRGSAVAERHADGVSVRFRGSSHLEVDFGARRFNGRLDMRGIEGGAGKLDVRMDGTVNAKGFFGDVDAITVDGAEADVGPSAAKGVFFGPDGPAAAGGTFHADTLDEHRYHGSFAGVRE